jgi:hypothetical protein
MVQNRKKLKTESAANESPRRKRTGYQSGLKSDFISGDT